jgi:hypothetical protein
MEKIASNLKVGLKFETDNVRQRWLFCGRDCVNRRPLPTLTHKQRRRGDNYGRQTR